MLVAKQGKYAQLIGPDKHSKSAIHFARSMSLDKIISDPSMRMIMQGGTANIHIQELVKLEEFRQGHTQ